jgi:hypothetical protein
MLRCTCESHIRSGWVCSHVIATLSLFGLLDLSSALSRVPVRRAPGRPRARRGGLEIADDHDGYFDIPKLIRLFLRRPGQPLQWKVVDEFEVTTEGDPETANFVGSVVAMRLSDGVYV